MGWVAPVAAAAHQRHEEVEMIRKLSEADPEGKYEFKIIRGSMTAFRKPEFLQEVLDIERQGSWEFVEKIDNSRVILRRTVHSKLQDPHLDADYDPYRTTYSSGRPAVIAILLGLCILLALGFFVGYMAMTQDEQLLEIETSLPMIIISISVFFLMLLVMLKIKRK